MPPQPFSRAGIGPSEHRHCRLLACTLALLSVPAWAGKPIYHCTKDGQTVLTDQPCDGGTASSAAAENPAAAAPAGTVQRVVGEWTGPTQFQGTEGGLRIEEAQATVTLTLRFTADGKVTGASPDNGCAWSGDWTPGSSPVRFSIELAASGCRFKPFDRRYTGNLSVTWADQSAQLGLQAFDQAHAGQGARMYDIRATLKAERGATIAR